MDRYDRNKAMILARNGAVEVDNVTKTHIESKWPTAVAAGVVAAFASTVSAAADVE